MLLYILNFLFYNFYYFSGYNIILKYIFLCCCLGFLIYLLSINLSPKIVYIEKISAFECGFEPYDDARFKFYTKFYLVGILFLIFDLEIIFLFPWFTIANDIIKFNNLLINFYFFNIFYLFIYILFIGVLYEWHNQIFNWE